MIAFITVLYLLASSCDARPNVTFIPQNVVTVPTNCPEGQAWVNGACRDVWRAVTAAPTNVVTVPTNCPSGQAFINGQCRDVWIRALITDGKTKSDAVPQNVVTVPNNCRPGQQWINGSCRDVWNTSTNNKNVITVPTNCPDGQEFVNGQCREVWRSSQNQVFNLYRAFKGVQTENVVAARIDNNRNVISVPTQCPIGYRPDELGNCRPIF